MGTNYYLHDETDKCAHCGHVPKESWHIGKSSAGWCFALHVYPESWEEGKPKSLADWQAEWSKPGRVIRDEYGSAVTPEEMMDCITNRRWKREVWQRLDYARQGPHGLWRSTYNASAPDDDGTYDLVTGYFS